MIIGSVLLQSSAVRAGETSGLVVHLLSGSQEYASETSLRTWSDHLQTEYGISTTLSHGPDRAAGVANLESLPQADVLVVFCRRWELVEDQAALVMNWIQSGKPVIAIRTASHAFQFYQEFDSAVLGGDYSGHSRDYLPVRAILDPTQHGNPILAGVDSWERKDKLYHNPNPAEDVTILLASESPEPCQPLAWTRINGTQRVFYTSMGLPADFENPNFIRLLDNALFWVIGSENRTRVLDGPTH